MPRSSAQEILESVDKPLCIVGNGNKDRLVETALAEHHCDLAMFMGRYRPEKRDLPVCRCAIFGERTRACLRIQDGCNNFCTYCIVPYTRGRSRSLPREEVLDRPRIFAEEGLPGDCRHRHPCRQIWQRPGRKEADCVELLSQPLPCPVSGVRFRLSSIEPRRSRDELLDLLAEQNNFMPHLHIPLQSGDDDILARMNRGYTTAEFGRKWPCAETRLPGCCHRH